MLTGPDLKPDNILLGIEDEGIINELIKEEENDPTLAKVYDHRCIYPSSSQFWQSKRSSRAS